ncbi:hypothetical protein [Muricoccus pecuniae]|uniref:Uncharacterized protein n=1 Tax=Muricoccus pecuniae TaxID=693023 RepID=A0A840Y2C1_9PROT|nr:hypothetical protein [Roseomonas pecuniae]MBB5694885.1 hypothetical protein [Roseomonas pecuniae]
MSSSNLSRTLRSLGLAAALIGAAAAPAFAEGTYVPGPVASPAWTASAARTPLAGNGAASTTPAQNFLERSGATGNAGQHA